MYQTPEIYFDSFAGLYPVLITQNILRGFHISTDGGEKAERDNTARCPFYHTNKYT